MSGRSRYANLVLPAGPHRLAGPLVATENGYAIFKGDKPGLLGVPVPAYRLMRIAGCVRVPGEYDSLTVAREAARRDGLL